MNEDLSALVDDQLDEAEREAAIQTVVRDRTLHVSWERYHLIGSALRAESTSVDNTRVERIAAAIEREPAPSAPSGRSSTVVALPAAGRSRVQSWAGWALAASLVVGVAVGFQIFWESGSEQTSAVASNSGVRWHNVQPEVADELTGMLVEHGEFTHVSGMNGLLAYAKVVSYDTSR